MILSSTVMTGIVSRGADTAADDLGTLALPPQPEPLADYNPWVVYNGTTVYHSNSEMETELFWIAETHPSITKLISIGKSWQGRDIWAMKVSDNPNVEEPDEPEVYFNSNHHAREWMTIEIALYALNFLTDQYATNASVQDIINNRQVWIIPSVNPDGRVYDSAGDDPAVHQVQPVGWRRNVRDNDNSGTFNPPNDGVDLNRNYGYLWGASGATSDPTYDTYGGPYPFSEPETAAVRDFCRQHHFIFDISFHTSSQLILYPWGWSYEDAPDAGVFVSVGKKMQSVITNRALSDTAPYTLEKSSELYPTAGSDDDWLYGEMGIFAYCVEAYPSAADVSSGDAAVTGSYDQFHPAATKVLPVCMDNLPAILLLCRAAGNPYQFMDHVSVKPETAEARIVAGTSRTVYLNITDDGVRADSFYVNRTSITGWTFSIPASSTMSFARNETKAVNPLITVPGAAAPGLYRIWLNATSTTNKSCKDSTVITIDVPYPDDVAPMTLEPFTELGDFPRGQYRIDSTVKNVGNVPVPAFNTQLTIKQLGVGSTVTLFTDNIESPLANQWTIVDHDMSYSNSVWIRSTTQKHAGTYSAWCGVGTAYTDNTVQSLMMTNPINLERYNSVTLQFWSYYSMENYYDFLMIEASDDNGKSWDYVTRYTNAATTWTLRTVDLSDFLGAKEFKLRFRFTSDDFTTAAGFYLDDVTITANDPTETTIYGPVTNATIGSLASGASQELSWKYTFNTAGTFQAEVQTLHATDGNAANNLRTVMFYINGTRKLPEFGGVKSVTNPGMGASLKIAWNAGLQVNDPLTYKVYRFAFAPTSAQVNASTPIWSGTSLEYTDGTVTVGTTYYYVVRAVDALGQAEYNYVSMSLTPGLSVNQFGFSDASVIYNFVGVTQATNDHYAYFNDMDDATQAELTTPNSRTEFTDLYYANLATSNNVRAGPSLDPQINDEMGVEYRYTIAEPQSEVTRIDLTHEALYSAGCSVTLYALNDANTWDAIGGTMAFTANTEATMTRSITANPANYISAANLLRVVFYPSARGTVAVDYAEAVIYHSVLSPDHNTLNWTVGGTGLSGYNIYRSDSQSGPWDAAHLIATVPSDTYSYVDINRGAADATFWWYVIRAVDGYGVEETNTNAVQEPGQTGIPYAINLVGKTAGSWAFVSYPVTVSGHIETVFNDTLNGDGGTDWDVAKTWSNTLKRWISYRKGGTNNSFTNMDNTMGAWLHLTANGANQALSVPDTGTYPGVVVINLYTGWNLVGYPSATSRLGSNTMPLAADMMSTWQAASPYIADAVPGAVTMSHGNGYWVRVTADCVWTVNP